MERVIVFGNSGFAEHVYFLLTYDSAYEVVAFTADSKYIKEDNLFGLPVVPFEAVESIFPPSEYRMSVSISFQRVNRLREEKYREAKNKGYRLINYLSSRATSFPGLVTGDNCIIMENSVIGPLAQIGNNVMVASGAILGHNAVIKDHCFIAPGAVILGGVTVDEYSFIGANATVKEEVTIASESLIGSGVTITKNTREKGVYLNPPAVLHPKRSDELRTWLMWPLRLHDSSQRPLAEIRSEKT